MIRHSHPNMLLRIAQADAYAIAYEYVKDKEAPGHREKVLKFERFLEHPTYKQLKPGQYSDDTQMSIAVAETLIQHGADATAEQYAQAFFECFKRDPRNGYSRGLQAILESAKTVEHMKQMIVPNSNKNGACMRAVPLGLIKSPEKVINAAAVQASVTHGTWGGINSAAGVALMSHFALYDKRSFNTMFNWCKNQLPSFGYFKEPWVGPVGLPKSDKHNLGIGMCTAWAVHTLVSEETTLMGMLKRAIEWGGDTDSVASIAWGIASARNSGREIPQFMYDQLEPNGAYGPAFLVDLGMRLMLSQQ